ncbi:MAG: SAF domain-containing protein, partial [Solirubrobacterales bacterium]
VVSRRGRSLAFMVAAGLAAAAAAAIADSYGSSVARGFGRLRPVVVAAAELGRGRAIDPALAEHRLEVRRVPVRFLPPEALADPAEALGLVPATTIPAGSYLTASQLRVPGPRRPETVLDRGRRPVEIAVSGAGALLAIGADPTGTRVDVVVTTEPSGAGAGRAYVAAAGVPLLALGPSGSPEVGGTVEATLGLTRAQALRLIAAQSFARQVTILPEG